MPLEHRQSVAGKNRHTEGKESRWRVTQSWNLAMQQIGQLLKMGLDFPAPPVSQTTHVRWDVCREIRDQLDGDKEEAQVPIRSQFRSSNVAPPHSAGSLVGLALAF
jgi:hypothetical protein